MVPSWRADYGTRMDLPVSFDTYHQTRVGAQITVISHAGGLGAEWLDEKADPSVRSGSSGAVITTFHARRLAYAICCRRLSADLRLSGTHRAQVAASAAGSDGGGPPGLNCAVS